MVEEPLISVIIPAKNEAANIGRCLDSLHGIDFPADRFEVLVIDNGSDDQTERIVANMGVSVYSLPDACISAVRNLGALKARGEVLAFIDADCTVDRDWLLNAQKYFDNRDVVCFGSAPDIPAEPTWVQATWYLVRRKTKSPTEVSWLESMNMFVRRDAFVRIGGFNENLITCEDVDLSYRISVYGRIISDQSVRAVHHGEAKNVFDFFRKECWRGRSNYAGFFAHGMRSAEIPSLCMPLYYLFMPMMVLAFSVAGKCYLTIIFILLWQLPIAGITFIKVMLHSEYRSYFKLYFLYNIYYLARGLSILDK